MECQNNQCGACCGGSCSGGCGQEVTLTSPELELLQTLAEIPFLPLGRTYSNEDPVYLTEDMSDSKQYSYALNALKLKGLIRLDFDLPLSGFDYSRYDAYPVKGSFALTARGQAVVELLEIQGITE